MLYAYNKGPHEDSKASNTVSCLPYCKTVGFALLEFRPGELLLYTRTQISVAGQPRILSLVADGTCEIEGRKELLSSR